MKIVAISDLHGYLPTDLPSGDILLIAGDIFPLNIQWDTRRCAEWLINDFWDWSYGLPYDKVIFIAGNHDIFAERRPHIMHTLFPTCNKVMYLEDKMLEIMDENSDIIRIYGTPWCHKFGSWAFMREDDTLTYLFNQMSKNIDILLTHDAPYGTSDICEQDVPWNKHEHIGNIPLRDAILKYSPKYCIHGHLHSTNHNEETLGETKVFNVSLKDELYHVTYGPLILDL